MTADALIEAVKSLNADDALPLRYTMAHWQALVPYLTRHEVRAGDRVVQFGDNDRVMFLVESGNFQVYVPEPTPVRRPVNIVRAGAVLGEPALFVDAPRMAQVEAMSSGVIWALARSRFEEFAQRQPQLALELLRAAGAVMALRMRANLERGLPQA